MPGTVHPFENVSDAQTVQGQNRPRKYAGVSTAAGTGPLVIVARATSRFPDGNTSSRSLKPIVMVSPAFRFATVHVTVPRAGLFRQLPMLVVSAVTRTRSPRVMTSVSES